MRSLAYPVYLIAAAAAGLLALEGAGRLYVHARYDHLLRRMIRYVRSQGATAIVYRYPSVRSTVQRFFSNTSARIAREEGAAVCDLESRFDRLGGGKAELFIETGVHVTPRGAEVLAAEVERVIVELEAAAPRAASTAPAPSASDAVSE